MNVGEKAVLPLRVAPSTGERAKSKFLSLSTHGN
jgi:hypothetical protein